ncbi:hypothetical protein C8J56DRAFT_1046219 [Mycena floridula]|nr:hypothetical protein C8J56DRAFT_1046219 [Mycena floridula]
MRSDLIELMKLSRTQEFESFHLDELESDYSASSLGEELWTWKLKNHSQLVPRAYQTVQLNEDIIRDNETIQSRMLQGRLSIGTENIDLYFGGKHDIANHFHAQMGHIACLIKNVWDTEHVDRKMHIWTTKDHTELRVAVEVSKDRPMTDKNIALDSQELRNLLHDSGEDVFAMDLAQEGKETYNAETGELEFKWRPKPETYDDLEPRMHDKIAQWKKGKSWVLEAWEDILETAMARTQITAEAPPLLKNGYADTTKIEPPLIIWDERHYFGIHQGAEIYLIPEGRYGLVIAEEYQEEMMDKTIKFLTGVDVMIDGQPVKMDFISQQTDKGSKLGKLWQDKLKEIIGMEVVDTETEDDIANSAQKDKGTSFGIETVNNGDLQVTIGDRQKSGTVLRRQRAYSDLTKLAKVTAPADPIDELDLFKGLTLTEPKETPDDVPQTSTPHLVKVDIKINKESRLTALVIPSMSRNMLRRSATRWLTGWEEGEIDEMEDGAKFNGVQIEFCGKTYELNMVLIDDMDHDVIIGKDWSVVGAESAKELRKLTLQSTTETVVLKIEAQLTREERITALLQPEETYSTISTTLVARIHGEESLHETWITNAGEYIQTKVTYQNQTITIAALVMPDIKEEHEMTLGKNWSETPVMAPDPAEEVVTVNSTFIMEVPEFNCGDTFEQLGTEYRTMEVDQSDTVEGHDYETDDSWPKIWAAPKVLDVTWTAYIIAKQYSIQQLIEETNEWSHRRGTKLAGYVIKQPLTTLEERRLENVEDILSKAAQNPNLDIPICWKLVRFYDGLGNGTWRVQRKVKRLLDEMRSGLTQEGEDYDSDEPLSLSIIDSGPPESNSGTSETESAFTDTDLEPRERQDVERWRKSTELVPDHESPIIDPLMQAPLTAEKLDGEASKNSDIDNVEGTTKPETHQKDLSKQIFSADFGRTAPHKVISAPATSKQFAATLLDVKKHWLLLSRFIALIRARNTELEITARELEFTQQYLTGQQTSDSEATDSGVSSPDPPVYMATESTETSGSSQTETKDKAGRMETVPIQFNVTRIEMGPAHRVTSADLDAHKFDPSAMDLMSEMPSGGAASMRPSLSTPAPILAHDFDHPEVDDFCLSAYWIPSGEQQPEGIWLDPVHRTAHSVTRDPFTKEGALYEPVFCTIHTGDSAKGELVLHSDEQVQTVAAPASSEEDAYLRYSMGIVGEGIYGFVVVFRMPIDGIPYHDAGSTANPSFIQPPQRKALMPKVQLVTEVVRLHHYTRGFKKRQHRILRKDTVLMLHNYQDKAIGPVVTRPGPNHMPILVSELVRMTMMVSEVSQRETHSRQAMRANPVALRYLTQHMPADERDTFICLVSIFVYL